MPPFANGRRDVLQDHLRTAACNQALDDDTLTQGVQRENQVIGIRLENLADLAGLFVDFLAGLGELRGDLVVDAKLVEPTLQRNDAASPVVRDLDGRVDDGNPDGLGRHVDGLGRRGDTFGKPLADRALLGTNLIEFRECPVVVQRFAAEFGSRRRCRQQGDRQ